MFEKERTYFELNTSSLMILETPPEILDILDQEGYYCPDYRQAMAYKKEDKLKAKPIKLIKVLSKSLKNDPEQFNILKKKVDERLGTSRKTNIKCLICITHNPYDVAGMSTDRNWTSCMNLDTGAYKDTPLKQVQYGGMCAYLIENTDKEIKEPIARIAIKRLVGKNDSFIFLSEDRIYGDEKFAEEIKFDKNVKEILNKSNKETAKESKAFIRNDDNSYSDAGLDSYFDINNIDFNTLSKQEIDELSKSKELTFDFVMKYGDKLNLILFFAEHNKWDEVKLYQIYDTFRDKIDDTKLFNYCGELLCQMVKSDVCKNLNYSKLTANLDSLNFDIADIHADEMNFTKIVTENKIGNRFFIDHILKKHSDKIDWEYYSRYYNNWSHQILNKFRDKLNWDSINKRCVEIFNKTGNIIEPFLNYYYSLVDIDYFTKHISFRKCDNAEEELTMLTDHYCNKKIMKPIIDGLLKNNVEIKNNKRFIHLLKQRLDWINRGMVY